MSKPDEPTNKSWLKSVPGILTGLAALITAVTGAIAIFFQYSSEPKADTPPAINLPQTTNGPLILKGASKRARNPSEEQIRKAINKLRGKRFVILSRSDQEYVQAIGGPETFTLEYRDGAASRHFQCEAPKERVVAAFLAYRSSDDSFRGVCEWKWLNFK